jgi:metallophosphoesterase superfamily enzyme
MEIFLGPTKVELLPGRAAFLTASKSLIVTDLHLGKAATFRARGLAVPEGSNASDLSRLKTIANLKKPKQIVIAGDLFHSADGLSSSTIELFQKWLQMLEFPVILTEGNHDRRHSAAKTRWAYCHSRPGRSSGERIRHRRPPPPWYSDQGIGASISPDYRFYG